MLRSKGEVSEVGREKLSYFFVIVMLLWLVIFAIYYIKFLLSGNILASRDDDHLFHKMAKYVVALGVSMALFSKLVRARIGMFISNLSFGIALSVHCSKIH